MARRAKSSSVSAARWLLGVLACVVLGFVLSTVVAERLESSIAGRANDIISNAMPSVQMLSSARGELRRVQYHANRYLHASSELRPTIHDQITTARQNIDAALVSYEALPYFPKERSLYVSVQAGLTALDADLAMIGGTPDGGTAEAATVAQLQRDSDRVDEGFQRMIGFDARQGQRLGIEIERIRGESRGVVVLLDIASFGFAVLAAGLALRQLNRARRAHDQERESSERHTAELAARVESLGQFAGRVAHDVLSPLSTSSLALELARAACADNASAQRATDRGLAALQRVQTLVEGLLAFSRAGGRPELGATCELRPVLGEMLSALDDQAKREGIDLRIPALPDGTVRCNAGVLTSLLSNLVRNAIHHMGQGPERWIEVRVEDVGDRWRFAVEDTGPGVPAADQHRIFEPYLQLVQGSGGIGLGLATVARLVAAHDGRLGLRSPVQHGRGSLFWFELPKPQPAAAAIVSIAQRVPA